MSGDGFDIGIGLVGILILPNGFFACARCYIEAESLEVPLQSDGVTSG